MHFLNSSPFGPVSLRFVKVSLNMYCSELNQYSESNGQANTWESETVLSLDLSPILLITTLHHLPEVVRYLFLLALNVYLGSL